MITLSMPISLRLRGTFPGLAAICAVALLVLAGTASASPGSDSRLATKIDESITASVGKGFSGAVLVARARTSIVDKGYGAERGTPITASSRFWIASAAKQFTSTAILKCREKGL